MTTQISTLLNGLRVVSENMPQLETASIGVWVDVGARYESADINGVSHLLEHMAFKGTKRRSALAIAEEIESVGGHVNAYTSREQTAYYAKVMKEDIGKALPSITIRERIETVARNTARNTSSMRSDRRRGRPTEIDFINGYMVGRGHALGVDVPTNQMLTNRIKQLSP